MSEEAILYEVSGRVASITLNRPTSINAYDNSMLETLRVTWRDVNENPDVYVVIIRGEGRGFCAGHDLDSVEESVFEPPSLHYGDIDVRKPVIAALHGAVLGGGASMAMACDIRIAADDLQFGYPQPRMGLMSTGGHAWLPRSTFRGFAYELMLTGRTIGAEEAHRIGLVNHVVARAELDQRAMQLAEEIAANGPIAVQGTKDGLTIASRLGLKDGIAYTRRVAGDVLRSDDAQEGLRAFREKRSPIFKGR